MNRDFIRGAIFALAISLLFHGLVPGLGAARRGPRPRRLPKKLALLAPGHKAKPKVKLASAPRAHSPVDVPRGPIQIKPDRKQPSLDAYRGLGSWVDVFNRGPWARPARAVARMHKRGVRTIYLQTATYGSKRDVVHRRAAATFITEAHRRDMKIVGWYVPSFARWRRDLRKARAGLFLRTPNGDRFNSFALDIEATNVDNVRKRNNRLLELSRALREAAGPMYPLGAIIPDSHSLYWPRFPYRRVAHYYDVMVPMGYFTFRAEGLDHVRRYTEANIRKIRQEAGPETPIHVIGGIADDVGVPAARGFIKAVRKHRVLGGSLYDYPITTPKAWKELSSRLP